MLDVHGRHVSGGLALLSRVIWIVSWLIAAGLQAAHKQHVSRMTLLMFALQPSSPGDFYCQGRSFCLENDSQRTTQ